MLLLGASPGLVLGVSFNTKILNVIQVYLVGLSGKKPINRKNDGKNDPIRYSFITVWTPKRRFHTT